MDPDQGLADLIDAVVEEDQEKAVELHQALENWILTRGYEPFGWDTLAARRARCWARKYMREMATT